MSKKKRVLLIDDEKDLLQMIHDTYSDLFEFVSFTSSYDGLEHYQQDHNFDLVIIDYNLGDSSAEALLGGIQVINPKQEIVVLTGAPEDVDFALRRPIKVYGKPSGIQKVFEELAEGKK